MAADKFGSENSPRYRRAASSKANNGINIDVIQSYVVFHVLSLIPGSCVTKIDEPKLAPFQLSRRILHHPLTRAIRSFSTT